MSGIGHDHGAATTNFNMAFLIGIDDQFLALISHDLKEKFDISHPTIQIENTAMHADDLFCLAENNSREKDHDH